MRFSYTGGITDSNKGIGFTHIAGCWILHPGMTLKMDDIIIYQFPTGPPYLFYHNFVQTRPSLSKNFVDI